MMGTAKESNRSRDENEEDDMPWKFVPHNTRQKLIKKLNPNATVSGNDWRMLANFLGYNATDINFIESDKDNNTNALFKLYDTNPEASYNAVYFALAKMQRQDCIEILKEAKSEIKQAYNRSRESQMFHASETSDVLMSGGHYQWSNPPCSCTYPAHPTSGCGSHTYSPCGHGFANCICSGHTHHLGHSPYTSHPLPPHPCQNLCQTDTTPKTCQPNLPSPCHTSPKEQLSCQDTVHQHIPSCYGYHGNSQTSRVTMPVKHILGHQGQAGLSPGNAGYQGPQSYNYNESANNSSSLSSTDTITESFNNRQKVTRPYSDDYNIPPDSSTEKRFRNDGSMGIVQGAAFHVVSHHDANGVGKPRDNQSPRFAYPPTAVNYMDYRNGHYQQEGIIKVENVQCNIDGKNMDSPPSSGGSSWDRSHPSSTFPMRVKAKQERTLDDLNSLTISKKSTSMPQNMKPAVYRIAFRHVKVFVTYSYDNDNHAMQVLSLCKFLQDNGFACCVDVREKENCAKPLEQLEWCRRKVTEADFVLVCISHKYLEDIASDRQTSSTNSNAYHLHSKEIFYELMNSRRIRGQHISCDNSVGSTQTPCLIPLLFPEMTQKHIPHCMASGPIYNWPGQYKDLAWILTKPQERIKVMRKTQNMRETDQEGTVLVDRSHFPMDGVLCNS